MPSKFVGTLDEFKEKMRLAGLDGEWQEQPNYVWRLKTSRGAGVNWSQTKGTIWCDGPQDAKDGVENAISGAFGTEFSLTNSATKKTGPNSRKVFVVYGHDMKARNELEAMLRRWDLDPLILDQLTSGGQTIIEKLESARNEANFAVVLATPDDEGHRRDHPGEKAYRARQNVVLELGMMLAVLGRPRVAILLKSDVQMERPSDIQGLIYMTFKEDVREVAVTLAKEINAHGIKIDLNKL